MPSRRRKAPASAAKAQTSYDCWLEMTEDEDPPEQIETCKGAFEEAIADVEQALTRDIVPAKKLGMRTALFAGDRNSLAATPEQLKDHATRPDVLLTELPQIIEVIG